jgi:hypothetical protein
MKNCFVHYLYGIIDGGPDSKFSGFKSCSPEIVIGEILEYEGGFGKYPILTCNVLNTRLSFLILIPSPILESA